MKQRKPSAKLSGKYPSTSSNFTATKTMNFAVSLTAPISKPYASNLLQTSKPHKPDSPTPAPCCLMPTIPTNTAAQV